MQEHKLQPEQELEQQEDAVVNQSAEEQALKAVQDQAATETAEKIPATEQTADSVGQTAKERGPSASEAALGTSTAPAFAEQTKAKKTAETQAAPPHTPAKTVDKKLGGPWTADSIAELVANKSAGGVIQAIARRDTENALGLLKAAGSWDILLDALPNGNALAAGTMGALFQLVDRKLVPLDDAKQMFAIRFGHPLTETSGAWTMNTIRIVWHQLDHLPARDVTETAIAAAFTAIAGSSGIAASDEEAEKAEKQTAEPDKPLTPERLSHMVRLEVGYGVHAQMPEPVDMWLQQDVGFWYHEMDDTGIDSWIRALGGYPEMYTGPDGNEYTFDDQAKTHVRDMISSYTGNSLWNPAPIRNTPDEGTDDWQKAMWAAMPEAVKNACAQSTATWWDNWSNLQEGPNHTRYFLNHQVQRPYEISLEALQAVEATRNTHMAMSEKDFFANCYAEFFKDPSGTQDQSRWGGTLPESIKQFFEACVVQRHPYDKFQQQQKKKEEEEKA